MRNGNESGVFRFLTEKFFTQNPGLYATPILVAGLVVTVLLTFLIYNTVETQERRAFVTESREIHQQLVARLEAHALMLRAGASFFGMSDTVTRNDWNKYISDARIYRYLPDVQGIGYAEVIPAERLETHIMTIREEGFPDYSVFPGYRRESYTSIVFVEPFEDRNRGELGYDMFTDSVRRRAMEFSRDYDVAALCDRIRLNREIPDEALFGTIMFVPVFEKNAPVETTIQRRAAIRGWLFSSYHINTLMDDLLKSFYAKNDFRVELYNERVSKETLFYDSRGVGAETKKSFGTVELVIPVEFNTNVWHLFFSRAGIFPVRAVVTLATGVIISLLLYFLARVFSKIAYQSAQVRLQNEELRILNATRDKFFSIIAHDLKSPYNAVLGFSEILVEKTGALERQEIVKISQIIRKSAKRAVDLLMNLMVWSYSQTGRLEYEPAEQDIEVLFSDVKLLYSDIADQKEIELSTQSPDGLKVFADKEMVGTILRNLVSNAIKFNHPGGKVILSAEQNNGELLFKVADSGVGIPPSKIDKLFRMDEHYTTEGTLKEKGTGLGLILCREFVEKHGGRIWVESKTGDTKAHGSTFYFTLPSAGG